MLRERALKVVLVLVGLFFVGTLYYLIQAFHEEALQMMLSIYVTLGVFLLLAVRNPSANRILIAFAAWSSLAHASVMAVQSYYNASDRPHLLVGVAIFAIIGIAFLVLAPAKQTAPAS
jgi:FtsH-binding integral membrane protein